MHALGNTQDLIKECDERIATNPTHKRRLRKGISKQVSRTPTTHALVPVPKAPTEAPTVLVPIPKEPDSQALVPIPKTAPKRGRGRLRKI